MTFGNGNHLDAFKKCYTLTENISRLGPKYLNKDRQEEVPAPFPFQNNNSLSYLLKSFSFMFYLKGRLWNMSCLV